MRDLAKQNFAVSSGASSFRAFMRILLLIVVVLGIFYFVKSRLISTGSGRGSIILQEAPRGLVPVDIGDGGKIAEGGVNLATGQATFTDVKYDGLAKASATRSFGGGVYILSVDGNLPDPKNTYYQVWLVGDGKVVPIDYMSGSKTKWSLTLRSQDKYSKYDGIWITLERTKDDLPEEHVLEGGF